MALRTQDPTGYYIWGAPGQAVVIHLRLDVVERLAAEVMRGFGGMPKRGAEIGGVLIGTIRPGVPAVVRIDDFETVPCEYRRGPSYLFTEEDGVAFEECCRRLQPGASPSAYGVGYFRSHTRDDGFSLDQGDIELLDHFFPGPAHVALLIKPYATKVSVGGFFVREYGVFPETTPLEFSMHRGGIEEELPAQARPLTEGRGEGPADRRPETLLRPAGIAPEDNLSSRPVTGPAPNIAQAPNITLAPNIPSGGSFVDALPQAPPPSGRANWVWFPLTLLFLLLGVALGYQLALTLSANAAGSSAQEFSLSLSVKKVGDNLSVTWNRLSPAVRTAQKGVLEIDDGGYTKPVALDAAQLQNGSLIYRNASKSVRFRLTVYPQARVSVVEVLEWKQ
jgi:hypothetical protein